jgi:hypothetical protein
MKIHTKLNLATRAAEIILALVIFSFVSRVLPNLNDLHPDSPLIDDKCWGNYSRMEFLATRPAVGTPTFKPVRPEKFWLRRRPAGIAV